MERRAEKERKKEKEMEREGDEKLVKKLITKFATARTSTSRVTNGAVRASDRRFFRNLPQRLLFRRWREELAISLSFGVCLA